VTIARNESPGPATGQAALADALQEANLPTLIATLAHITGDDRWLSERYRPTAGRGVDDNDDGGLPEAVQNEVRSAARDILMAGTPPGAQAPTPQRLARIFSIAVGEPVGPEYGMLLRHEMGFEPLAPAESRTTMHVAIVGAGASGLAAAVELERAGIGYTIFDKNCDSGGTWFENRYPGCGCDTPSHLYSFRRRPEPARWTRYYAPRAEIHAYLAGIAKEYGVERNTCFKTTVTGARWQPDRAQWGIGTRGPDGAISDTSADAVINATGMLNRPFVPDLPGLDQFAGPAIHTACWPADLNVAGKRVVVIGTGASAMQLVPTIAGTAAQVTVIQRSPQWAMPNPNYKREVSPAIAYLMAAVPVYAQWYRLRLLWIIGDRVHRALQIDPDWIDPDHSVNRTNDSVRRFLTDYMLDQLGARRDELAAMVVPSYPPFGKRMLMDNGWFATLTRDDVNLVTDCIDRVGIASVRTSDGTEHPADILVLATGFESRNYLGDTDFIGVDGTSLRASWGADDARAYLGMTVPNFPNLFLMYGPNTNPHAGSVLFYSECQARYVAQLLRQMAERDIAAVTCRQDVFDDYIRRVDDAHSRMVWTHPRVSNYYRNAVGRVVTNLPWRQVDYFEMTYAPNLDDYLAIPRRSVR
jgi:4-hydroxyacetophenone monooxygenase